MSKKFDHTIIFADGACSGNPGRGGWGAVIVTRDGIVRELGKDAPETTNNRMELMAAIQGLLVLTRPCLLHIYTDSEYVQKGISQWIKKWRLNGWKTAENKPIKNVDLWQKLEELSTPHQIEWFWVKGHSGHMENERVDALAKLAIDDLLSKSK